MLVPKILVSSLTQGQAVYTDIMAVVTSPQLITLQYGEMATDISCYGHMSALLTHNYRFYVFGNIGGHSHVRLQERDDIAIKNGYERFVPCIHGHGSLHLFFFASTFLLGILPYFFVTL